MRPVAHALRERLAGAIGEVHREGLRGLTAIDSCRQQFERTKLTGGKRHGGVSDRIGCIRGSQRQLRAAKGH